MAMAEAGFSVGSRFRARDSSPESVVFTLESNYSVFSSTSASVERCSFASDAHDYDCRNSEISLVISLLSFEVNCLVGWFAFSFAVMECVGFDILHDMNDSLTRDEIISFCILLRYR